MTETLDSKIQVDDLALYPERHGICEVPATSIEDLFYAIEGSERIPRAVGGRAVVGLVEGEFQSLCHSGVKPDGVENDTLVI